MTNLYIIFGENAQKQTITYSISAEVCYQFYYLSNMSISDNMKI